MGNLFSSPSPAPNPTNEDIEKANRLREEQEGRERAAKTAREKAQCLGQEAKRIAQQAREAQAALEETRRIRDEIREVQVAAENAAEVARQEARRSEEARTAAEAAEQEASRHQQLAEETIRRAEEAQSIALKAAESAREQTQAALKAIAELERQRREGFQPVIMPTNAELEVAKRRIGYQDGFYHFAVAGMAGSGKSSMANALRGLRNNQKGAAATGITETTLHISRLPDPNPGRPFVWYDIPGAGTLQIEDWQYFHKQGLYIFDALIVLIDNRFTSIDIAILRNARLFKIPCYIVRSKADIHIRNIMHDSGYESDDEEYDFGDPEKLEEQARDFFITKTRENVQQSLRDAGLPDQRVYIVSKSEMLCVIKGNVPPVNSKKAKKFIDEEEFLSALEKDADRRRGGGAAGR